MADFDNVTADDDSFYFVNQDDPNSRPRHDSLMMNVFSDTFVPSKGTRSLPPPSLPQLVAEQHMPIPAQDKDSRRLVVVLSNASLETYRAAHGSARAGRPGVVRDEKFTLLNSDEHIGIMRKMGRDISDARPDITHHVCNWQMTRATPMSLFAHMWTKQLLTRANISACSHFSTHRSIKPANYKSTYTPPRTSSSRSHRQSAYPAHSSALPVSWCSSYIVYPFEAPPHLRSSSESYPTQSPIIYHQTAGSSRCHSMHR